MRQCSGLSAQGSSALQRSRIWQGSCAGDCAGGRRLEAASAGRVCVRVLLLRLWSAPRCAVPRNWLLTSFAPIAPVCEPSASVPVRPSATPAHDTPRR